MADWQGVSLEDSPAIAFLAAGGGKGRLPDRRIDTHCAAVFLFPGEAWKLKKPVALGYLDFSDAGRRRDALETELRINRRTAPGIYREVVPVVRRADGTLALGGLGEPVDWALRMERFPDDAVLLERVTHGADPGPLAPALADCIARFHLACAPAGIDGAAAMAEVVGGNARSLRAEAGVLGAAAVEAVIARQGAALAATAALLQARSRRVVRGHGDLHLGNVAILDGAPVLFDALEFDEALATIDVAYDLAFLLADLWTRGFAAAANAVFNRWLDRMPDDEDCVGAMPLFLATRAIIRAHVTATRSRQLDDPALAAEARALLGQADAMLAPAPASLVAVGGLSGTGKSLVARGVAPGIGRAPGARVVRTDVLRKRHFGRAPEERLPPEAYAPEVSREIYGASLGLAEAALGAGQGVVLDAVFARAAEREAAADVAARAGVPFRGIWLTAPLGVRVARIGGRAVDASDADAAVAVAQEAFETGALGAWRSVDADAPPDMVLDRVRAALG
jgi:hypothetical protein